MPGVPKAVTTPNIMITSFVVLASNDRTRHKLYKACSMVKVLKHFHEEDPEGAQHDLEVSNMLWAISDLLGEALEASCEVAPDPQTSAESTVHPTVY